jgi:ubiquinone/menaquinone biosynthesis C-methylase UbiE
MVNVRMHQDDGWHRIIKSLESIRYRYNVGTELIGLFLPDFTRRLISCIHNPMKVVLDVGAGTGAMSRHILGKYDVYDILIDVSWRLVGIAKERLAKWTDKFDIIIASSEKLPIRDDSIDAVYTTFVFRDVIDHNMTLNEFKRVLEMGGVWLSGDLGKPLSSIKRRVVIDILKVNISTIGRLLSLNGYNPWIDIIATLERVPSNPDLFRMIRRIFPTSKCIEIMLGGVYINVSYNS